jgi:hypothetical protein
MQIGLISDTHGLLREEAIEALKGVDLILHGGDIGDRAILQTLEEIAELSVVRGNNDYPMTWPELPEFLYLELEGFVILQIHDKADSVARLKARKADIVIFGHSHRPADYVWEGVRYINPGAAGKKRFSLPISVAILTLEAGRADIRFVNLLDERPLP